MVVEEYDPMYRPTALELYEVGRNCAQRVVWLVKLARDAPTKYIFFPTEAVHELNERAEVNARVLVFMYVFPVM